MGAVEALRAQVGKRPQILPGAAVPALGEAGRRLLQRRSETLRGLHRRVNERWRGLASAQAGTSRP